MNPLHDHEGAVEMGGSEMPFVAVIGGLWQLGPEDAEAAKAKAREIGAALATAGFGLVGYFSNEGSLEPHVVAGYVGSLGERVGAIRVRYPEGQRGQVRFAEEAVRPDVFEHRLFPGQDWEAPFYRSLAEQDGVDAVLLLAGATSTYIAGQIAVARRLPTLAVDEFGGSAAKIWTQLAAASPDGRHSSHARPISFFVDDLARQCAAHGEERRKSRLDSERLQALASGRRLAVYASGTFALLLAALFMGLVSTPIPAAYPAVTLVALIAAGATGAIIRAILTKTRESDPLTSLLLGAVAGFAVGLAYLIPQWIGAPGVLDPAGSTVSATDKIQLASAVLVALSAGVGFDAVFNRLKSQAEEPPTRPASG
jgi:hypothetical protein